MYVNAVCSVVKQVRRYQLMSSSLDKKDINYLLKLAYKSDEISQNHDTDWMDKYSKSQLEIKFKEIGTCTKHDACKTFAKLVRIFHKLPR